MARKAGLIGNNLRNWTLAAWGRDDLGPTAWNCHLHQSLRFSGSSNHLIHAFLAVASLGNLCPPKLLHLGTQHSVPRLFLLRLSMPPTATHQQDNSYGGSAIWRVSKFVIPLIENSVEERGKEKPFILWQFWFVLTTNNISPNSSLLLVCYYYFTLTRCLMCHVWVSTLNLTEDSTHSTTHIWTHNLTYSLTHNLTLAVAGSGHSTEWRECETEDSRAGTET